MKPDTRVILVVPAGLVVTVLLAGVAGIGGWIWIYIATCLVQYLAVKVRKEPFPIPVAHLISLFVSAILYAALNGGGGDTFVMETGKAFSLYLVPQLVWLGTDWYIVKNLRDLSPKFAQYGPTARALAKKTAQ